MTIDLIVFDWDGTLSDSAGRIVDAVHVAAERVELPKRTDQQIRDIIGLGLIDSFTALYPDTATEDVYEPFAVAYREAYLNRGEAVAKLFPGVVETLASLHGRCTLAIATGRSREGLDRELKETNVGHYFAATRCADETAAKPDPRMLHEIFAELSMTPEQTVMIGDTDHDIKLAQNANVRALAVQWGAQLPERIQAAEPLAIFDRIDQFPEWLSQQ